MSGILALGVCLAVIWAILSRKTSRTTPVRYIFETQGGETEGNKNKRSDHSSTIMETSRLPNTTMEASESQEPKKFLENHLTLSLFFGKEKAFSSIYLTSEYMILGGLTGVVTWMTRDTDSQNKDSEEFEMQELIVILLASGITSFVIGIAEVSTKVLKGNSKVSVVVVTAALGLFCFLLSVYLCSEFCEVWSVLWTYSLLAGILLEVLLSQPLRALIKASLTK